MKRITSQGKVGFNLVEGMANSVGLATVVVPDATRLQRKVLDNAQDLRYGGSLGAVMANGLESPHR